MPLDNECNVSGSSDPDDSNYYQRRRKKEMWVILYTMNIT